MGDGIVFFVASTPLNGRELWKTNGTPAGTVLVLDINPGAGSADPDWLTMVNGILFFRADDGVNGMEPWRSDGTAAGTMMIKDINPGSPGSFPNNLLALGDTLFFAADDGVHGNEMWTSHGTAANTVLVRDLNPHGDGIDSARILKKPGHGAGWFTNYKGKLFFAGSDGADFETPGGHGTELWKSDGTAVGTELVNDIYITGTSLIPTSSYPAELKVIDNLIWFAAARAETGKELFRSDGTFDGTYLVADINPGPEASSNPADFTKVNDVIFFSAATNEAGRELWRTDGTEAGTYLILDMNDGGEVSGPDYVPFDSNPEYLINYNGRLFFAATTRYGGNELWESNGVFNGTYMVLNMQTGGDGGYPSFLTTIGNKFYFTAADPLYGNEIFRSDGTPAGTMLVQDIEPDLAGSNPEQFLLALGRIFVVTNTSAYGKEVWVANVPADIGLPLRFLDIDAKLVNDDGLITWQTADEINAGHFEIERSTDGIRFHSIGWTQARNQPGTNTYHFTDAGAGSQGPGTIYYRIREVDADNSSAYSDIALIRTTAKADRFMVYPNPVDRQIGIRTSMNSDKQVSWELVNASGAIMKKGSVVLHAGNDGWSIDVSEAAPGTYVLRLSSDSGAKTLKIIKR